jgi:hypothetical protein
MIGMSSSEYNRPYSLENQVITTSTRRSKVVGVVAGPVPFRRELDEDPRPAHEVSIDFVSLTSGWTGCKSG